MLKDKQLEVLQKLYFPTGYGKFISYQLLLFLFDHKLKRTTSPPLEQSIVLIVSPLVSVMVDQVSSLQDRFSATILISMSYEHLSLLVCHCWL